MKETKTKHPKQFEQPTDSIMYYMDMLMNHLTIMNNAMTEKELKALIPTLLEYMCKYANADRAYVFEREDLATECYTNTYEWCREGVTPQIDELQQLPVDAMPVWHRTFMKGETISFEDLESTKDWMPMEYEILLPQNVQTLIAVPMNTKESLYGFIGLDNPRWSLSQLSERLLLYVGGNLTTLLDHCRFIQLLEEKQAQQEEALMQAETINSQSNLIRSLCMSYDAVYSANLHTGVAINYWMKDFIRTNYGHVFAIGKYADNIRLYKEREVIAEDKHLFDEIATTQDLTQVLGDRTSYAFNYRVQRDGQVLHFQCQIVKPTIDSLEVAIGFKNVEEIVAEEKKNNRIQLEQFRIINALSKDYRSLCLVDTQTRQMRLYQTNEQGENLKRLEKLMELKDYDTIVKTYAQECIVPEDRKIIIENSKLENLASKVSDAGVYKISYQRIVNDTSAFYEFNVTKALDENGAMIFIVGMRDINEDVQEKLRYTKDLQEAYKAAEAANKAKTEFLSRMSHDIRTPMNGILGMSRIAEECIDDKARVLDSLHKINQAGRQLEMLINDVLDMSRLESGRTEFINEPFEISTMLQTIDNSIHIMAEEYGIKVLPHDINIQHDQVIGSSLHLQRILLNILTNAVKYNQPGGTVGLGITEKTSNTGHSFYQFKIVDTGIGMSPEFLKKIFEPFSREHTDAGTKYMGTGLGMAITKELVTQLGGTISVESKEGEGSTFIFSIPLDVSNEVMDASKSESHEELPEDLTDMHILLAEDNSFNLEIATFMLESAGATVDVAVNGKEALDVFLSHAPGTYDLILMDIMMPEMNGLDATRQIRMSNHADATTIPIVAMTANAFVEDVRNCISAGMNGHIAKPLDLQKVRKEIAKYQKDKRG